MRSWMRWSVAAMTAGSMLVLGACTPPVDPGTSTTTTTTPEQGAACQIGLRTIATALEAHRATYGSYPATMAELVGPGGFLEELPGPEFVYVSDGASYTLTAPCGTEPR